MPTTRIDDADIEVDVSGDGEPILLIHGSNLADGLRPLATAMHRHVRGLTLVRYHRRGMGASTGRDGKPWRGEPVSIEQHAADVLGLLDALGLPSAHILGYSYGGTVAIEAALAAPDRVRSLILVEPTLREVPSSNRYLGQMAPVMDRYRAGDVAGAVTATFTGLDAEHWRELLATIGPDAFEQALRDGEFFYRAERPSLEDWTFSAQRAAAVRAPVLSILGTRSGAFFDDGRELIHQRFPQCADADISDVNHLLYLQAPKTIALEVARFLRA
ncbi:alpha/beta fold hydrolase [Dactylosporangium sp. McL0621]|uniref:alpha/beta fold hydrolase n=1 Tax=Dactylosporangium sp. McL0621 TaxID=3415678 RepID=UPI003CF26D9B